MWRVLCSILGIPVLALLAGMQGPGFGASELKVHEPVRHGNLAVFPITGGERYDASRFLTLDEGLAKGLVKVGELGSLQGAGRLHRPVQRRWPYPVPTPAAGGTARVNELAIQNLSGQPLILLAGEVVSGGKQDRVVARDRIIPPHGEPVPLGVFCVEPGRWHGLSTQFAAAKSMAHPELRKKATEARDQQQVWNEVAASRAAVAEAVVASPAAGGGIGAGSGPSAGAGRRPGGVVAGAIGGGTSYARTMDAKPVQDALGAPTHDLASRLPRGTTGVVVAVNGRIVWADVFASPALFERYRQKLLQSYVVEAMRGGAGSSHAPGVSEARDFLRPLTGPETTETEPGVYRLVRTEANGLVTYELEWLGDKAAAVHFARMSN